MAISVTLGTARAASLDVGGLRVSELAFPPLLRLAPHGHERACVAVVVGGAVEKRFRGEAFAAGAGAAVTMPPGGRPQGRVSPPGAPVVGVEPGEQTPRPPRPRGPGGGPRFPDAAPPA